MTHCLARVRPGEVKRRPRSDSGHETVLLRRTDVDAPPHRSPRRAHPGHLHLDDSITPVVVTDFDVAAYIRRGTSRLPVDSALHAQRAPAPARIVRLVLGVLQRLEASALAESRAMLATSTGNEARITAFLATWMVDRFWQSRALRDLLTGDHPVGPPRAAHRPHPTARAAPHPRRPCPAAAVPAVGAVTGEGSPPRTWGGWRSRRPPSRARSWHGLASALRRSATGRRRGRRPP